MDDPIEIVARAIVASDFDGDETVYDTMSDEMKAHFLGNARAALLALREPPPDMIYVAEGYSDFILPEGHDNSHEGRLREMRMAFRAAIDHALQTQEKRNG